LQRISYEQLLVDIQKPLAHAGKQAAEKKQYQSLLFKEF
jgi:hypothetical protein